MNNNNFSGFWQRFLMFIVDAVIISGLVYLASNIFELEYNTTFQIHDAMKIGRWIAILVPTIYILGFWLLLGATPGKILGRAKIVDAKTGERAKIWQLFIRYICYPLSKALIFLGFIWVAFDSRKQGWHDKLAGTVVIKREKTSDLPTIIAASGKDNSLWKFGRILFALSFLLIIGIIYFINYDEQLNPEAAEWLYAPEYIEENPADNGYYDFIAMAIPSDEYPNRVGHKYIEDEKDYILRSVLDISAHRDYDEINNVDLDYDTGSLIVKLHDDSLYTFVVENYDLINNWFNKYSYMQKRYYHSLEKPVFQNTSIPHIQTLEPIVMNQIHINLLNNTKYASDYLAGAKQDGLNEIGKCLSYDRLLAEKADNLMTKLVATVLISRDLKIYDFLLEGSNGNYEEVKKHILDIKPINLAERDFTNSAKREFLMSAGTFVSTLNFKQNIYTHRKFHFTQENIESSKSIIFKPNATLNIEFKHKKVLADLSHVNGKQYNSLLFKTVSNQASVKDMMINPIGSILANIAAPIYNEYVGKFHYIDGYLNMLKLKVMILDEGIASEDVPSFLENYSATLYNPFTEEAISWDAERSMLYFVGPDPEDNKVQSELKINLEN